MINILMLALLWQGPSAIDQYGQTHGFKEFGSDLTVLDFAASWCKPCWKALPQVERLAQSGVEVLVISVDEKREGRDKLVKQLGLTVPVIWDQGHAWANQYQPEGMPTTMIVDKHGKVVYHHVGYDKAKWKAFLAELDRLKKREG